MKASTAVVHATERIAAALRAKEPGGDSGDSGLHAVILRVAGSRDDFCAIRGGERVHDWQREWFRHRPGRTCRATPLVEWRTPEEGKAWVWGTPQLAGSGEDSAASQPGLAGLRRLSRRFHARHLCGARTSSRSTCRPTMRPATTSPLRSLIRMAWFRSGLGRAPSVGSSRKTPGLGAFASFPWWSARWSFRTSFSTASFTSPDCRSWGRASQARVGLWKNMPLELTLETALTLVRLFLYLRSIGSGRLPGRGTAFPC